MKRIKASQILVIVVALYFSYLAIDRIWLEDWKVKKHEAEVAKSKSVSQTPRSMAPISVDAIVIKKSSFDDKIVVSGTLLPDEEIDLRAESSGKITAINFKEGSNVSAGMLLVKINDKDLQAQYNRAMYRQKLAEDKERRQRVLLDKEAVSKEEYETALTELNSLKAETELIKAQIERTEIRAPFNGVVGLRKVSVGEYISPSIVVAHFVKNDPIKLDFTIPERYNSLVKKDAKVSFRIDGSDKDNFADIYAIEPQVDLATRTVRIRAKAPNKDGKLYPGSFARVQLSLTSIVDAIMVPAESLISEASGQRVYVYRNGIAEAIPVVLGTRTVASAQVLQGLSLGDTLVVTGILQVRDKSPLKLKSVN